eukprot:TRINITY_DN9343_c0_g1_i4.p1 TRINITY_DN9343_c0_g1~~TRINITY_DN9343_c0_g1_i4.p1  ORF type:complete len:202 (+),score=-12.12 TRINITY_DN9343_c0_g1_i4:225-830(+)
MFIPKQTLLQNKIKEPHFCCFLQNFFSTKQFYFSLYISHQLMVMEVTYMDKNTTVIDLSEVQLFTYVNFFSMFQMTRIAQNFVGGQFSLHILIEKTIKNYLRPIIQCNSSLYQTIKKNIHTFVDTFGLGNIRAGNVLCNIERVRENNPPQVYFLDDFNQSVSVKELNQIWFSKYLKYTYVLEHFVVPNVQANYCQIFLFFC